MAVLSENNRRSTIESELANLSANSGEVERLRIPWKEGHEVCPVIDLNLDAVVLNHRSHRIRAQLESHPERDAVQANPFGEAGQEVLRDLLHADEGFDDLKANIEEEGQRNPGVITRAGLLVNANRRAVALRALGRKYIRVAVLPPDASREQIAELELRLQMTKEFKQDYTFTNQLLFVEELRSEYQVPVKRIALLLGYAQSSAPKHLTEGVAKVEQATRMLAIIKELQALSEGRIGYPRFDEQMVAILELDETYEKIKKQDPAEAERLRVTRFIGLITAPGYKILRRMDAQFFEDYLLPTLEEDEELNEVLPIGEILRTQDPTDDDLGLDLLDSGSDADPAEVDPDHFATWLARLDKDVERPQTGDVRRIAVSRDSVIARVRASLEGAVEQARNDDKKERRVEAPLNRVKEAIDKVKKARSGLGKSMRDQEFDRNDFEYKLKKLEKAVRNLRETFDSHAE